MGQWIIFALIIFGNAWIWKIGSLNFPLFAILIFTTVIFWRLVFKKSTNKLFIVSLVSFGLLIFFQWKTTIPQSLVILDNDEQRIRNERLTFYNPSSHYLRVLFARLNLKDFFEGDFNTALTRLQKNLFESIDPNVYFFRGHPRERVWANDFEKFHFIFIIPFLIGLYRIIQKKNLFVAIYFGISIVLLTLIGHKNTMGPYVLFPLFIICIWFGFFRIK